MERHATGEVPRSDRRLRVVRRQNAGFQSALAFLVLTQSGCFTELAVPSCATLADCPAHYTECGHSHCFFRGTRCEQAAPVSGDGCCSGWEADRTDDGDCQTFDLDLEVSEFSLPAVRASDGMLFFHARSTRDDRVHLLQVTSQGRLVWDLPLGTMDLLLPPLLWDDGTIFSPTATGIQVLDVARQQAVDLIPSPTAAATPLCASEDALTFVDQKGSIHLVRPGTGLRIVLPGKGETLLPPVHSRKAQTFLVARADGFLRGVSPEATSSDHALMATLDLGVAIGTPPVITGDQALLGTTSGTLVAVALGEKPWRRTWEVPLGGPISQPPLVDSRGRVLVVRQDGTLFVIREVHGQGAVIGNVLLPGTGELSPLLVTEEGRMVLFRNGRLRSLRVREEGGGAVFTEGYSYTIQGRRGVPSLVDRRIVLALDTGRLLGLVSLEGPDSGPWSRPSGDEANRMSSR